MYQRHLGKALSEHFKKRREILILLGARQVGKTTIIKRIFPQGHYLLLDNESVRSILERYDISAYKEIIPPNAKTIIIDEIHLLSDPGRAAKIIFDQIADKRLVITGSSAFNIKNKAGESLAGRKIDYFLYPLTISEYLFQKRLVGKLKPVQINNIGSKECLHPFDFEAILENVLVFGLYPHLINQPNDKLYLKNMVDSVIFKDILDLSLIENRPKALSLLRALALQISSLTNINELANRTGLTAKTVKRYIAIFEQSFIIFSLSPFTKRKRDEIGKMKKYYFYDLGIRNALINNFQPVDLRPDKGSLWENFVIAEVLKANYYGNFGYKLNFWRNKQGSEIDLILEKNGKIKALEIKLQRRRINRAFVNRYPLAKLSVITPKNFI